MKVDTRPEGYGGTMSYTTLHCQNKTYENLKLCLENNSYSLGELILYPNSEIISHSYYFFQTRVPVVTPVMKNSVNFLNLKLNTNLTYQILIFDKKNRFISPFPEKLPVTFYRLDNKTMMSNIFLKVKNHLHPFQSWCCFRQFLIRSLAGKIISVLTRRVIVFMIASWWRYLN